MTSSSPRVSPTAETVPFMGITSAPPRYRQLGLVFALVLASRIPFVFTTPGVGKDPDSWRLLLAGQMLVDTGEYRTSRLPGYPVLELFSAAVAGSPVWLFVLVTAIIGALGVAAFADLLLTLGVRAWWWPAAAMALTPVIYRSDLTFMDYSWSLAGVMGSMALLARGRWAWAGAVFGLAVACRPAAGVLVIGVCAYLLASRAATRSWVRFGVPAAVTGGAFLALPVIALGPSAIVSAVPESASPLVVVAKATTGVWGGFGAAAVAVALVMVVVRWWRGQWALDEVQRPWAVAAVAATVAMAGLFLLLPADPGYLAPIVPMVLLLLALTLTPQWIAVVAALLAVSAFVAPGPLAKAGPTVTADRAQRIANTETARVTTATIATLPPGTVVVVGYAMPELLAQQPREMLADPALGGPYRQWSVPEYAVIPGGQILTHERPTRPTGGPVYRLQNVPGDEPLLPLGR